MVVLSRQTWLAFTITDKIDSVLKVNKDRIALKSWKCSGLTRSKQLFKAQLEQSEKNSKLGTGKSTKNFNRDWWRKNLRQRKLSSWWKRSWKQLRQRSQLNQLKLQHQLLQHQAAEEITPTTSDSSAIEDKETRNQRAKSRSCKLEAELKAAKENLAKPQAPAQKESRIGTSW